MKHILLTISLIFGATAVSAEIKAGQILQNGKIIHTNVVQGNKLPLFIHYHVMYKERYYTCQYEDLFNKDTATAHDTFGCIEVMEIGSGEELSSPSGSYEDYTQKKLLKEWGNQIQSTIIEEVNKTVAYGGFKTKGRVLLNITISTYGDAEKVEIAESSGNENFDLEAKTLARIWSYPFAPSGLKKRNYVFQIPIKR